MQNLSWLKANWMTLVQFFAAVMLVANVPLHVPVPQAIAGIAIAAVNLGIASLAIFDLLFPENKS